MAHFHDVDRYTTPPEISDIEAMAREAMATIPQQMRNMLNNVSVQVEDFPEDEVVEEMGLESSFDLLGLYRGVSLLEKSSSDSASLPDTVHLFRRPILDYWAESGEDLREVVAHVIIHEIGHHFGFSDEEMERIEEGRPPRG